LPENIEVHAVQLPGRWERTKEPLLRDMNEAVTQVTAAFKDKINGPFAVAGFSLGALISFEWIRQLCRDGDKLPIHFFVLSRSAPQIPPQHSPIHTLPDQEFLNSLKDRYLGLPTFIFDDPDMRELFVPARFDSGRLIKCVST
jgi:medium-chain acyl-[acyl-carrier-protein] hydrolase